MPTDRKQPLRALLRSRGYGTPSVEDIGIYHTRWVAGAYDRARGHGIEIDAPTRRAALAGLVAVLQALPEKRRAR